MTSTYRAVEVSASGTLRVVERKVSEPGAGQVRIRVEACGICHTDAATVAGIYPGLKLPRVPGHEVVGRIEGLGSGVSRWKIGQRVGVGLIAGEDGVCEPCRRGDAVNCQNPVTSGVTADGGYAEVMIAEARALSSVPDELTFLNQNDAFRVATVPLLRDTEKNRAHQGFDPGCHLLRGNAIGRLEPAACRSKSGPGSGGREQ